MTGVSLRLTGASTVLLSALAITAMMWPLPALAQGAGTPARWVADFGDTTCSLSRAVGPEAGTYFRLEWGAGGEAPDILIGNLGWRQDLVRGEQPAILILTPGETRIDARAVPLSSPVQRARGIMLFGLDERSLDTLSNATGMAVEVRGRRIIEFALPRAAAAVRTLRMCNSSLLHAMGVDPAVLASLRRPPKPVGGRVGRWVNDQDYPADALRRGASGTAVVRLTIGADGRVKDCTIASSSGDASLDRQTCALIQRRGRFEPAIGADGSPVDAPLVTRLRWVMATL